MGYIPGEKMTEELLFIDALNLVRDGNGVALVVINSRDTKDDGGNFAVFLMDKFFGFNF